MALSFNVQQYITLFNEVRTREEGGQWGEPADIAAVSADLAVVVYETGSDQSETGGTTVREYRIRGYNPTSGEVYYDDQLYHGFFARYWIIAGDDTRAFGHAHSSGSSASSGLNRTYVADVNGWSYVDHTAVGISDYPAADGTPGTAYFYRVVGVDTTDDEIWTFDLDTLARTVATVPIPTNLSQAYIRPFRGGGVTIGYGSNGGTIGHVHWFKIGVGWVDYVVPGLPGSRIQTAGGTILLGQGYIGSDFRDWGTQVEYDPAADTFALISGYRPVRSDDGTGTQTRMGYFDDGVDPGSRLHFVGVDWQDEQYDDTGLIDPYQFSLYAADRNGAYAKADFAIECPFDPDPVDFNTYNNFDITTLEVRGNRFAATLNGNSGSNTDPAVEYWHIVIILLTGTIGGGWNIGWLGAAGVSALSGPSAVSGPSAMGRSVAETRHRRGLVQLPDGTMEVSPALGGQAGRSTR